MRPWRRLHDASVFENPILYEAIGRMGRNLILSAGKSFRVWRGCVILAQTIGDVRLKQVAGTPPEVFGSYTFLALCKDSETLALWASCSSSNVPTLWPYALLKTREF